ncbi:uncharacterized protein LAESUDRAFT_662547, partial [Laetiporus sulphureus 93-53]
SALIFFEYIVTFSEEVHVIWGARSTTVTIIFALNRYLLMVQGVNFALNPIWWHAPLVIVLIARICPAVSDLIVVIVTWFKTFRLAIEVRKLRLGGSTATLLMRDGEYMSLSKCTRCLTRSQFKARSTSCTSGSVLVPCHDCILPPFIRALLLLNVLEIVIKVRYESSQASLPHRCMAI